MCVDDDCKSLSGQQQKWQLRREGWHENNFFIFLFFSLPFLYPFVTGEGEEGRDGPNWLQRPLTVAHAVAVWLKHTPKNRRKNIKKHILKGRSHVRQEKDFFLVYDGTYPFFPYAIILCVAPPWFEGQKKVFCPRCLRRRHRDQFNLVSFFGGAGVCGKQRWGSTKKKEKRGRGYDDDGSKKGEEREGNVQELPDISAKFTSKLWWPKSYSCPRS